MSAKVNEWKLGLFVVLGVFVGFGGLVTLGASRFDQEVVPFVTYFDESVEGLEVDSKVKFRGVPIGRVSQIGVAPDRRHVLVECSVDVAVLEGLGLRPDEDKRTPEGELPDGQFVPADMRIQLVSQGITGVKFLQADFFDPEAHPPPGLPFPTPPNYVPSAASSLKSIEGSLVNTLERFPKLADQVSKLLSRVETFLDDADIKGLTTDFRSTLKETDKMVTSATEKLGEIDVERLTGGAQQAIDEMNDALSRVNRVMERVEQDEGLLATLESTARTLETEVQALELGGTVRKLDSTVASVDSTSISVGTLANDLSDLTDPLEETLEALQEAAESVKRLADALERDSDMLLKGRAKRDDQ